MNVNGANKAQSSPKNKTNDTPTDKKIDGQDLFQASQTPPAPPLLSKMPASSDKASNLAELTQKTKSPLQAQLDFKAQDYAKAPADAKAEVVSAPSPQNNSSSKISELDAPPQYTVKAPAIPYSLPTIKQFTSGETKPETPRTETPKTEIKDLPPPPLLSSGLPSKMGVNGTNFQEYVPKMPSYQEKKITEQKGTNTFHIVKLPTDLSPKEIQHQKNVKLAQNVGLAAAGLVVCGLAAAAVILAPPLLLTLPILGTVAGLTGLSAGALATSVAGALSGGAALLLLLPIGLAAYKSNKSDDAAVPKKLVKDFNSVQKFDKDIGKNAFDLALEKEKKKLDEFNKL